MARGYDRLAGVYEGLEHLSFGPQLQRARHIGSLAQSQHILILGEGDGRFLAELLALNSHARIDCVDLSRAMLAKAARRSGNPPQVRFIHADATDHRVLDRCLARDYDAVVTLFFLDNFTADTLRQLVPTLAARLRPGGVWLQSDFRLPERGWRRWRAHRCCCSA
ncbi:MAG: class I SAM-dependent methyltransferase [Trueperaceae bacterium]|nr:class I SAM-dependent methyltransferase [Trueperaceae bacterium]